MEYPRMRPRFWLSKFCTSQAVITFFSLATSKPAVQEYALA
jgi:hypothetical protein